jgi:cytoskeletal protein RodZ
MAMRRNSQLNPMRMLAMLAVLWAAGTWLFATENPQRARKAEPTTVASRTVPVAALTQTTEPGPAPQSTAAPKEQAPESATNASDSQPQANSTELGDEQGDNAPAKGSAKPSTADKGGTPQRFVPSEQVRADFDVSFPIDI